MALPSDQYFSNSIVGMMQAGADVDIYATHSTPKFPLGQGFTRADGNVYRYASFDGAVTAGRLVAPVVANAVLTVNDNNIKHPDSATIVEAERPIKPGQVGSHYIQITLSGIAANKYEGGYLITNNGSGRNYTYRIVSNTATGNPVAGDLYIQLYDRLQGEVSANSDIIICPSMFNSLDVASTGTNWGVAGVSTATTTATLVYGWICTKGVVGCLQDGAWTGGDQLALSPDTNGSATTYGNGTTSVAELTGVQVVGYALQNGGDTEQGVMYLQVE